MHLLYLRLANITIGRSQTAGIYLVTEEIWVCENQTITKWPGDIFSYKEHLRKRIDKDRKNRKKLTSLATGH
uniref:Uncharacterized protein n=1 Tax=Romanomermis culicivorax TaxID=13658 RepID=A0A915K193_ROMCU